MSKARLFDSAYRYDIALDEGVGPWMVAWISGLMVFFATLAVVANFALAELARGWAGALSGGLTVELSDSGDAARALDLAKRHPAAASARRVGEEELRRLVEPWIGGALPSDLPLPGLVEVELKPDADAAAFSRDIKAAIPGAKVDAHAELLGDVRKLAAAARAFITVLTAVIGGLAVVSVAGIVRARFSIHREEVETLHWIGAADEYIARQFRQHTLKEALKGSVGGLVLALLTLFGAGRATRGLDLAFLPRADFAVSQWVVAILAPVVIGCLVAHLAAQRAVMRELAKLP